MNNSVIEKLNALGQSIWLDNINRSMLNMGKLKKFIGIGLRGMTSNPTIFDKAISSGGDYDDKIVKLGNLGKSAFEIYDDLTVQDVQDAADIFRPVYKKTEGLDGYVSLEVNPKLAFKIEESIKEAKRLHKKVNRPNIMFKIPSTKEGFEVIEELIANGINVNITLIFSVGQYIDTAKAYMRGIRRFIDNKKDAGKIRSVASVFVSRVDTVCDKMLDEIINKERKESEIIQLKSLRGKAAIANAALMYKKFREILISDEFQELKKRGANIQRVLWGSTSTKDPSYSDIKYVAEVIGKDTVNTVPDETFSAFLDHGEAKLALGSDIGDAQEIIKDLKRFGIDIDTVCARLLLDGVTAFEKSFDSLLTTIEETKKRLCVV